MTSDVRFVDRPEDLRALRGWLEGEPVLALDSEFVRERTFRPKLEIVQIAGRSGEVAIVDYGRLGAVEGDPLVERLRDPGVLKVFHAAEQDLEMLAALAGAVPDPIWDTQVVPGLYGYTGRLGYAAVAESLLGVRPRGGETLTDWSRRPLAPEQIAYAAEDVCYLLPLYEAERERLAALGRVAWAEEECARLRERAIEIVARRGEAPQAFRRVRGWQRLNRRGLAVLRELATWRAREAARWDRPEGTVVRDDLLLEIARRPPRAVADLRRLRGLDPRFLDRHGEAILAAVRAGSSLPADECPEAAPPAIELDEGETALGSLCRAALQALAQEKEIAPATLAAAADVERLVVAWTRGGPQDGVRLLAGWRAEAVGKELVEVLEGRRSVAWNAAERRLELREPR